MPLSRLTQLLQEKNIRALILDLDGVITQTAQVHARAWKKMFDDYLFQRGEREKVVFKPLEIETDYLKHIDGIPRYDGVRNFLASRNIILPEGSSTDPAGKETVAGLGNLKNDYFQELIRQGGIEVYPDTIAFLKQRIRQGYRTAVISASKNCRAILSAAGLEDLFEVCVDGVVSLERGLKGKPAPDVFLEAAKDLGVMPREAAVFEDAQAGVEAGKAGGFALVVGINRANQVSELIEHGADLVLDKFPTE